MRKTNILTTASLFLICVLLTGCQNAQDNNNLNEYEIDPVSAHETINSNKNVIVLDIRTSEEYELAHLENSIHVPLDELIEKISSYEKITTDDEIIIYCNSGVNSYTAYNILNALGYKNVRSMTGGIIKWMSLGYKMCSGTQLTC